MYVLNRDSKNNVTISSPLEAHKSQTIVLTTEGLDVGYDNPIFACLELNYAEADEDPTGEAAAHTEKLLTRSEEHTSELQSRSRISYAVFCLTWV